MKPAKVVAQINQHIIKSINNKLQEAKFETKLNRTEPSVQVLCLGTLSILLHSWTGRVEKSIHV